VVLVGVRMTGPRAFVNDEQLGLLRVLVDRRRSLGEDHTRMVSQVHALLLQLIPPGARKELPAAQAKALLASMRPRDELGKTRRRVAAELIADLERMYARSKAADKELAAPGWPLPQRIPPCRPRRRRRDYPRTDGRAVGCATVLRQGSGRSRDQYPRPLLTGLAVSSPATW